MRFVLFLAKIISVTFSNNRAIMYYQAIIECIFLLFCKISFLELLHNIFISPGFNSHEVNLVL